MLKEIKLCHLFLNQITYYWLGYIRYITLENDRVISLCQNDNKSPNVAYSEPKCGGVFNKKSHTKSSYTK